MRAQSIIAPFAPTIRDRLADRSKRCTGGLPEPPQWSWISGRVLDRFSFLTLREHDFTDNILHLVLARLPDAPAGTRGLSLFLIPKFMVNPDGSLGARNDARAHSVEHKLGNHGSPTCTMVYGDQGGARITLRALRESCFSAAC
jgi:alkylation response protein AidB-like acyl-CoA dehydrogenase